MHQNLNHYVLAVTLALFLVSLSTRALPFIFSRVLQNSESLNVIGNYLRANIMCLLVIYEIDMKSFTHYPYGIPALLALGILTLAHLWRRNMLLSLFAGTTAYVLISYLFS